ncbi:MAG: NAD(P)H-dependent glycerol-3-phosphate dehydrogenase [Campylobacterales bacterium]|nr:NAD(P)H-dependent glycerol-3-phosphate dehydrogenase [Campylobacterales bacterium]
MKIGVIGAGKWGQALHYAFLKNHKSIIYSRTPKDIEGFSTLEEVLKCDHLVFALPAQVVREWLEQNFTNNGQRVLVAAKGIEVSSGKFLNEIFKEHLNSEQISFLSGPSFAAEVIKSLPTALVISSTLKECASSFSTFFPDFIKTYISSDIAGAEISGAYKNVIAIAGGICDGLNLGANARASLIARGLVEMARFGEAFGACKDSFLGLSGAGDLFLSASSKLSRNYRVGLGIAQEKSLEEILLELKEVAEGVYTARAIEKLRLKHQIYTPIASEVVKMLDGKSPLQSLKDLLSQK